MKQLAAISMEELFKLFCEGVEPPVCVERRMIVRGISADFVRAASQFTTGPLKST